MANNEINQVVVNGNTYTLAAQDVNLATVETDASSSSKSYAVGDHLVVDNTYCEVIAAISAGDTLVIGSNIKKDMVADEIKENSEDITQLNTSVTNINTSVTNINNNKEYKPSSRVINAQTDLLRVVLGDNNHVINQPYYFSTDYGALTNMPPGAPTTSAFYGWREVKCVMSLTTVILHEMYPNYGRTYLNTYDTNANTWYGWRTIGGSMRPNFSNLLASLTTDGTVTATQDSFLVGTINQYGVLSINNVEIGKIGDKPVNFYLPLKTGDIVKISNYAQMTTEARIRIYGVLY